MSRREEELVGQHDEDALVVDVPEAARLRPDDAPRTLLERRQRASSRERRQGKPKSE